MAINTPVFDGEWALILGGSSGIGRAIAFKLYKEGMNVCIVHRDRKQQAEQFEQAVKEVEEPGRKIITFNKNGLDADMRREILNEWGDGRKCKVLVHAISRGNLKLLAGNHEEELTLTSEDFRLTTEAMATSLWDWSSDLFTRSLFAQDARIIGLTSEGATKSWPYYAAVSMAKSSLESLCRSMAVELGAHGIKTNIVQSGVVETPSLKMIPGHEAITEMARARNPLGRLTKTEDVANAVYLLCRPEAAWINGATIRVDGGEAIR